MLQDSWRFKGDYEFRIVDSLTAEPNFKTLVDEELGGPPPWEKLLSDNERESHSKLKLSSDTLFQLRVGVYFKDELIAFSYARHTDSSNLHMSMSCVHTKHRRKGIYSELLATVLRHSKEHGFQSVDSYHRSTNNPVIIAKLRAGFVINGMTLSDIMGCLVRLTYFHHPERRKLMEARSGMERPEGRVKELFF